MWLVSNLVIFAITLWMTSAEASPPNNSISAHVLDIAKGRPGEGIEITCFLLESDSKWRQLAITKTDENGRVVSVHPNTNLETGVYKLRFETKKYFETFGEKTFYPYAEIVFEIDDASKHYHVPLTLSNYGYSTYKGQ